MDCLEVEGEGEGEGDWKGGLRLCCRAPRFGVSPGTGLAHWVGWNLEQQVQKQERQANGSGAVIRVNQPRHGDKGSQMQCPRPHEHKTYPNKTTYWTMLAALVAGHRRFSSAQPGPGWVRVAAGH